MKELKQNLSLKKMTQALALGIAFLSFHCAPQGNGILGNSASLEAEANPKYTKAPFAYDVAVDTISYNSCTMESPGPNFDEDSNPIFGLRVGVAEGFVDNTGLGTVKGGLKLKTDFLKYVAKTFYPDYPNTTIPASQIQRILNHKDNQFGLNGDPKVQFAIRKKSNLSAVVDLISPSATDLPQRARDISILSPVLAEGFVGYSMTKSIQYHTDGTILAEGPRVYNLSNVEDPIRIEGLLNFNTYFDETYQAPTNQIKNEENLSAAEAYSQVVRNNFNSGSQFLAVTFSGINDVPSTSSTDTTIDHIENIRRPFKTGTTTPDTSKAYGRGFKFEFSSQNLDPGATWPKNRLTTITEMDLENGSPATGASWTCEQFTIVRAEEWNNDKIYDENRYNGDKMVLPSCMPLLADDLVCDGTDNATSCAKKAKRLEQIKKIRRQYTPDKWNIGLMHTGYRPDTNASPNTNGKANYTPPYPTSSASVDFENRNMMELCVSPTASTGTTAPSCYLRTTGVFEDPAYTAKDIGVQYERRQNCYLTSSDAGTGTARDAKRALGRCAQFASVCSRTSTNF